MHDDLEPVLEVKTVALDDYIAEHPEVQVGLVKSDIQGGELPALEGATELLRRDRPTLIIEEWPYGAKSFDYSMAELKKFLVELGYEMWVIRSGNLAWSRLEPASTTDADVPDDRSSYTNLLCRPKAKRGR